jgi:hypothetical protein
MHIGGFEIQVSEEEACGSSDQFLKRRAVSAPAANHKGFVGLTGQSNAPERKDDDWTRAAREKL